MTESRWQVETGMKDMSNSSASSSLNQVDGGVIHVTDRSHKYNAGWYSAMRPCLSISGGALLFYLWS